MIALSSYPNWPFAAALAVAGAVAAAALVVLAIVILDSLKHKRSPIFQTLAAAFSVTVAVVHFVAAVAVVFVHCVVAVAVAAVHYRYFKQFVKLNDATQTNMD